MGGNTSIQGFHTTEAGNDAGVIPSPRETPGRRMQPVKSILKYSSARVPNYTLNELLAHHGTTKASRKHVRFNQKKLSTCQMRDGIVRDHKRDHRQWHNMTWASRRASRTASKKSFSEFKDWKHAEEDEYMTDAAEDDALEARWRMAYRNKVILEHQGKFCKRLRAELKATRKKHKEQGRKFLGTGLRG